MSDVVTDKVKVQMTASGGLTDNPLEVEVDREMAHRPYGHKELARDVPEDEDIGNSPVNLLTPAVVPEENVHNNGTSPPNLGQLPPALRDGADGSGHGVESAMVSEEALSDIDRYYRELCAIPSDISEHLPTLKGLAAQCKHVTEFGTRSGVSTTALLAGRPGVLVTYDVAHYLHVEPLRALAKMQGTEFAFCHEDTRQAVIGETDMLFIDSFHVYEQLKEELRIHSPKVRRWIVMHDTETNADRGEVRGSRGLRSAIDEFLAEGYFRVKDHYPNNHGLTVLERVKPSPAPAFDPDAPPPWHRQGAFVAVFVPFYASVVPSIQGTNEHLHQISTIKPHIRCVDAVDYFAEPDSKHRWIKWFSGHSCLTENFNASFAAALNSRASGYSHWCMLHGDVGVYGYWGRMMLDEMKRTGAEVLARVYPIKDQRGATTCAVLNEESRILRRITMRELDRLPVTFDWADVIELFAADDPEFARLGNGGWELLVPDGLLLVDLTRPWITHGIDAARRTGEFPVRFETPTRIVLNEDGTFGSDWLSEDWFFSRLCNRLGVKLRATKCVDIGHWGEFEYAGQGAWGQWDKDEGEGCYRGWELR